MTELISLLGDLKTLEAIAKAAGVVPVEITNAIDKVLAALGALADSSKPVSISDVLTDVSTLIGAVDELNATAEVKQFAKQVLQLVENIGVAIKLVSVPASVVIKDVPAVS